jgi:hypothetical protein
MSSKPNRNESTETEAVRTRTAESPDGHSAHAEIRGRAYEIYLERGEQMFLMTTIIRDDP